MVHGSARVYCRVVNDHSDMRGTDGSPQAGSCAYWSGIPALPVRLVCGRLFGTCGRHFMSLPLRRDRACTRHDLYKSASTKTFSVTFHRDLLEARVCNNTTTCTATALVRTISQQMQNICLPCPINRKPAELQEAPTICTIHLKSHVHGRQLEVNCICTRVSWSQQHAVQQCGSYYYFMALHVTCNPHY